MFEIAGASKEAARECFNRVAHKLPVSVRLVERRPGT
jgi:large subunit ribosomal protein L16